MSEYYSARRAAAKDVTGLVLFVIGWLGSAPVAWQYIRDGFASGDPTNGVLRFAVVVFSAAIVCGLIGMGLGAIGGWIWEQIHRRRRAAHPVPEREPRPWESEVRNREVAASLPPLPPITYNARAVSTPEYIALANRFSNSKIDSKKTTKALKVTVNIGAWDGERLVGVARLLTDGYFTAALAELTVDPDYQRRGMGRELMNLAFEATPRGTMSIAAPVATAQFFDKLGCDRGLAGYTMRRAARRNGA